MIEVSWFDLRLGVKCKSCHATIVPDELDEVMEFLLRKECSVCKAPNTRTVLYAEAIEALLADFENFLYKAEHLKLREGQDPFLCGNVRAAISFHGENFCIDRFTGVIADCLSCRKHGKKMFIHFPFDYLWRSEANPSCPRCGATFKDLAKVFDLLRNLFKDFRKLSPLFREQILVPVLVPDLTNSIHWKSFYGGCSRS